MSTTRNDVEVKSKKKEKNQRKRSRRKKKLFPFMLLFSLATSNLLAVADRISSAKEFGDFQLTAAG